MPCDGSWDGWSAARRNYRASYIATAGYRYKGIASGQFVVAVSAISMLRFRISTATKQKAG
jgi:hypothetical protein